MNNSKHPVDTGKTQFLLGLTIVLLILMLLSLFTAWSDLPENIPLQFSFRGVPQRYGSSLELLFLAFLGIAVSLPLSLAGRFSGWIVRHPGWINVPHKDLVTALPPEKQAPYWQMVAEFMASLGSSLAFLFFLLVKGILAVCLKKNPTLPFWALWPGLAVMGLIILYYIPGMLTMPHRLSKHQNP